MIKDVTNYFPFKRNTASPNNPTHLFRVYVYGRYKMVFRIELSLAFAPFQCWLQLVCFLHERGLPVQFCVDFNHCKSIFMSYLLHSKTLKCSFLNNVSLLSHMLPTQI